jgi:hypothetical protein
MSRNDWILTTWLACALLGLALIALVVTYGGSQSVAAWVQALGAIAAILGAFVISHLQTSAAAKQEARRRDERGRALAYLLMPSIVDLMLGVKKIRDTIETNEHGMALVTPVQLSVDDAVAAMTFNVVGDRDVLLRIDAFPPAIAARVVRLFSAVEDFDELVAKYLPEAPSFDGTMRGQFIEEIDRKFAGIEQLVSEVNAQLTSVFG